MILLKIIYLLRKSVFARETKWKKWNQECKQKQSRMFNFWLVELRK